MNRFVVAILWLLGGLSLVVAGGVPAAPSEAGATTANTVPVWLSERVAPGGQLNALALDAGGVPHILFVDETTGTLRYATRNSAGWAVDDIAPFPLAAPPDELSLDIAVGANGRPCLAYVDAAQDTLFYGCRESGAWTVAPIGAGGRLLALAASGDGRVHLALVRGQQVTYAYSDGGAWQVEAVGQPDPYVWNLSLALDSQGRPQLAYTGGNGSFHAVRTAPNSWAVDPLPFANVEAFALGAGDTPAYLLTVSQPQGGRPPFSLVTLLLAVPAPGGWVTEPLWQAFDWSARPSLAARDDGRLDVAFYDVVGRLHAVTRELDGRLDRTFPATGLGWIGLALGPDDRPRLAHSDGLDLYLSTEALLTLDRHAFVPLVLR